MKRNLIAALLALACGLTVTTFVVAADIGKSDEPEPPMYTAKCKSPCSFRRQGPRQGGGHRDPAGACKSASQRHGAERRGCRGDDQDGRTEEISFASIAVNEEGPASRRGLFGHGFTGVGWALRPTSREPVGDKPRPTGAIPGDRLNASSPGCKRSCHHGAPNAEHSSRGNPGAGDAPSGRQSRHSVRHRTPNSHRSRRSRGRGLIDHDLRLRRGRRRGLGHHDIGRGLILRGVERAALVIEAVPDRAAGKATGDGADERAARAVVAAAVIADDRTGEVTHGGAADLALLGVWAAANTASQEAGEGKGS